MVSKNLKMVQCNLQRCYLAQQEFLQHFATQGYDVALISEPYVGRGLCMPSKPGLVDIYQFPSSTRVKACVVLKAGISAIGMTQFSTPNLAVVQLKLGQQKLFVASAYVEPDCDPANTLASLAHFLTETGGARVLVGGDLNGRHPEWRDLVSNQRGEDVAALAAAANLAICNVGRAPTFEAIRHGSPCSSIVDVTYASQNLRSLVADWKVDLAVCPSSDHNAITFLLKSSHRPEKTKSSSTFRYNTQRADWSKFKEELSLIFNTISEDTEMDTLTHDGIDLLVKEITEAIQRVGHEAFRRSTGFAPFNPWWSDELEALKKKCIKLHHRLHDLKVSGRPLTDVLREQKEAKRAYAAALTKASTEHFRTFCNKQGKEDVWSVTNRIIKDAPARKPPQTLHCAGTFTSDGGSTASALLEHFYPDDGPDMHIRQRELRSSMTALPNTGDDLPFAEDEIRECLRGMNAKKAPGLDHLTADICLEAFNAAPLLFTSLYNRCLETGHFPTPWKAACVRILPKPGKTNTDSLNAYRPIGLLPVFAKALEKLLISRLAHKMEREGTMSSRQFGFRAQTSTTDALETALDSVREAKSQGDQVVAVSLDIKAAFDNAWWPSLFGRLRHIGCPRNIFRTFLSYVENRTVQLDFANGSARKQTTKGCIQGSACGPMLWNIILDELLTISLPAGASIQAFADDVLLIVRAKTAGEVESVINQCLAAIDAWGTSVKLAFGPEKTQGISFTPQSKGIAIAMGGSPIPVVAEMKLLGVVIDDKLRFISHARYILGKATKIFHRLCLFVRPTWGVHPANVETIYRAVVIPMVTYAAGIWGTATRFCSVRRALRSFQRGFAIRAIRGFHTISAVAAEALAQFPPLHLVVDEVANIHRVKRRGVVDDLPSDIALYKRVRVAELLHPAERVTITFDEAQTQDDATALINPDAANIFTDGSKLEEGDTGAAFVALVPDAPATTRKFRLGRTATVFMAELYAVHRALEWSERMPYPSVKIFSDSQSALKAVQDRSNPDPLVQKIHGSILALRRADRQVDFVWTKAHVGIVGNELADLAAKEAARKRTANHLNVFPLSHAKRIERAKTLAAWQLDYETSPRGSTTKAFFGTIQEVAEFKAVAGLSFASTQLLSGHGFHKEYLHRFKITDDNRCPCDGSTVQSVWHLLKHCPKYYRTRHQYENVCAFKNIAPYKLCDTIKNESATKHLKSHIEQIVNTLKSFNKT
jgi:ribonuclease HI